MRLLISVLAMLVVGFLATQAKANLVVDLLSGRSDIEAAPNKVLQVRTFLRFHKDLQSKTESARYRAMAVQWHPRYWSHRVYGHYSAEGAVRAAVSKCESKYNGKCGVFSVESKVVVGFSKQKLAAAIEAYDRGNKKTVTADKSATLSNQSPEQETKYDGEWQGTLIIDCHRGPVQFISDMSIVNGAIDSVFSADSFSYRFKGYVRNDGENERHVR